MSQYFNIQQFSFRKAKPMDGTTANIVEGQVPTPPSVGQTTVDSFGEVDGRRAWLVVFGSFCAHIGVLGVLYSFGIFVASLEVDLSSSRAEVALIGTINLAAFYIAGIFAGPFGDKYGVQPVMAIGGLVWCLACILASFSVSYWQSMLTQGAMLGVGSSLVYWPAISVVPMWFDKYRGTAVGLATVGSGLGNVIFAFGGSSIIEALGWRVTLRVFSGVGGFLILTAVCFVKRRVPPRRGGRLFDAARALVKQSSYRFFLLATFLFQWGFFIPYVHLAVYSTGLGLSVSQGGLAIAMLGIGSTAGRLLIGPIGDVIGRMLVFRVCMLSAGIMLAVLPVCTTLDAILAFAFLYAFFAGGFIAQSPVVCSDLWGAEALGGTFALLNMVMIPGALAGPPIAGQIYQTYGSYSAAFWGGAFFLILSGLTLFCVRKGIRLSEHSQLMREQEEKKRQLQAGLIVHASSTSTGNNNNKEDALSGGGVDIEKQQNST